MTAASNRVTNKSLPYACRTERSAEYGLSAATCDGKMTLDYSWCEVSIDEESKVYSWSEGSESAD